MVDEGGGDILIKEDAAAATCDIIVLTYQHIRIIVSNADLFATRDTVVEQRVSINCYDRNSDRHFHHKDTVQLLKLMNVQRVKQQGENSSSLLTFFLMFTSLD